MEIPSFNANELALKLSLGSAALFPTDTLPALAATPENASQLWKLKERPLTKPLILMGASLNELLKHIDSIALEDALEMGMRYWPGALTVVLPSKQGIVDFLNPGASTIGLRIPDSKPAKDLLRISGPLATTSANLSGQEASKTALEAAKNFPGIPLLSPLPWPTFSGIASTVICWESKKNWRVLRNGAVMPENLEN